MVRQDIDWVGSDKDDSVRIRRSHLGHDLAEDRGITPCEV
jgi:hypothetical protein